MSVKSIASLCRFGKCLFQNLDPWFRPIEMLAVLLACVAYFWEYEDREQQRTAEMWNIIDHGVGSLPAALEYLNERNELLADIDVSNKRLNGVELPGADLRSAKFNNSDLGPRPEKVTGVRNSTLFGHFERILASPQDVFESVDEAGEIFRNSCEKLSEATGIPLTVTNLSEAIIWKGELKNAKLTCSNLVNADVVGADLTEIDLRGANLEGADFRCTKLTDANLQWANCNGTYFDGADLTGAVGASACIQNQQCVDEETKQFCDLYGRKSPLQPCSSG